MENERKWWEKYRYVIITISILLIIYLFVYLNQEVDFFFGKDFTVMLSPQEKSVFLTQNEQKEVEFSFSIDAFPYCKAACSYTFNDLARNTSVGYGISILGNKEGFKKSYNVTSSRLGTGQDLYSFDVECSIIPSFLCRSSGPKKTRTALLTLNYDLSEREKSIKETLKSNLTTFLLKLREIDELHQKVDRKLFDLSFGINLDNVSKEKLENEAEFDALRIDAENFRTKWGNEEYLDLQSKFNSTHFERLDNLRNSIMSTDMNIGSILELHNTKLKELDNLGKKHIELNFFVWLISDLEPEAESKNISNLIINVTTSISSNNFESYEKISEEIDRIRKMGGLLENKSISKSIEVFSNLTMAIRLENDRICFLKGICMEFSSKQEKENIKDFGSNFPDSSYIKKECNKLDDLNASFDEIRKNAVLDSSIINEDFISISAEYNHNLSIMIQDSYAEMPFNLPYRDNLSKYILSTFEPLNETKKLVQLCNRQIKKGILEKLQYPLVVHNTVYDISSEIETKLSENPAICCMFSKCRPCCTNVSCASDPSTYPVIFVHGHSFKDTNTPEYSLDAFNKIQNKLAEEGYINAGTLVVSQNETIPKGEWGLSGKPLTVKTTYYYDVYRSGDIYNIVPTKSESIDTYALRLNEVIDFARFRTGKDKVNIVAFSMGGLVARKYLQIFNDDAVNKLIMIGVPNKGVGGRTSGLCPVFGESKECVDMTKGSLFLNKLNDPGKQPLNVRIYNIIGYGCTKNNQEGDGVVFTENADLKGIRNSTDYYVKGNCNELQFHTDLLDPEKYPESYNYLVKSLKE